MKKLILISLLILLPTLAEGATVTDSNVNTSGQILVGNGTGTGHQGTWTDVNTVLNNSSVITGINTTNTTQNTNISTLQTQMTTANTTNATQTTNITTLQGQMTTANTNITTLQGSVSTLNTGLTTTNTNVTNLTNVVNGQTTDITALQTSNNNNSSAITSINETNNSQDTQLANHDQRINDVNNRVDDLSNRVAKMERTQNIVGVEARVYDSRKVTLTTFADYSSTRNVVDRVGIKVTYKVGKSYEEKRLDELQARLDKMEGIKRDAQPVNNAEIYTTESGMGIRQKF